MNLENIVGLFVVFLTFASTVFVTVWGTVAVWRHFRDIAAEGVRFD